MRECERPDDPIVCASRYATQVERYLEFFDCSRLLVVDQHLLRHERRATLSRIFAFLGVDRDFWVSDFEQERNTRADKHALTPLGRRIFHDMLDPIGRRVAPQTWPQLRPAVRRSLSQPITERAVVDPALREKLSVLLGPQVDRLRELTGEHFASWSL